MASEQVSQNEFIVQVIAEATRAAIQTMATAVMARQENPGTKMSGPILKQPTFNWKAEDKHEELQNFKLEVSNMLQDFSLGQTDRVSVIKNCLGGEGLQLTVTLTKEEQNVCNDDKSLFKTLRKKFKPQFNEMIESLQFYKLVNWSNVSAEGWMGRIRTAMV